MELIIRHLVLVVLGFLSRLLGLFSCSLSLVFHCLLLGIGHLFLGVVLGLLGLGLDCGRLLVLGSLSLCVLSGKLSFALQLLVGLLGFFLSRLVRSLRLLFDGLFLSFTLLLKFLLRNFILLLKLFQLLLLSVLLGVGSLLLGDFFLFLRGLGLQVGLGLFHLLCSLGLVLVGLHLDFFVELGVQLLSICLCLARLKVGLGNRVLTLSIRDVLLGLHLSFLLLSVDLIKFGLEPLLGFLQHLLCFFVRLDFSFSHLDIGLVTSAQCRDWRNSRGLSIGIRAGLPGGHRHAIREATELDNYAVLIDKDSTSGLSLSLNIGDGFSVGLGLDVSDGIGAKVGTTLGARVCMGMTVAFNCDLRVDVLLKGRFQPD